MAGRPLRRAGKRCGAIKKNGQPCPNLMIYNGGRCKHHGGQSTGPRSAEGKARSALNLRNTPNWKKKNEREAATSSA